MKEQLSLDTSFRQQQRLTPLQVQFVRMLEMNTPEIEETVRRALDEMPALEVKEGSEDEEPVLTTSIEHSSEDLPGYRYRIYNHSADDSTFDPVSIAGDHPETLMEVLASQVGVSDLDSTGRHIAAQIIGNIDDNGYITRDLESIALDVADAYGCDVTADDVDAVWQKIRHMDPPGVGAVDLRDCLLLQLRVLRPSQAVDDATEMVSHYFDIFSKKQYERLRSAMGIDETRLRDAIDVIRHLNPKPGAAYASGAPSDDTPRHVVPDFAVEVDGDRLVLSSLNHLPELQIEKTFDADTPISSRSVRDDVNLFIRSKRNEAQEFIRILSMRQETLYRVMQAIVKIQREFFLTGDETLIKPMILKDISNLTGYGLSVISRATSGKYVATTHGIYPLKMLFNERPKDDSNISSHRIQSAIKQLIEKEDKRSPLSDDAITSRLVEQGFNIARRTVAKYRERLGFPVARLRKEI